MNGETTVMGRHSPGSARPASCWKIVSLLGFACFQAFLSMTFEEAAAALAPPPARDAPASSDRETGFDSTKVVLAPCGTDVT